MRHRKAGVKLNMTSSHKTAMFRNMVTSLFKYDRIQTTDVKAKELRRWADKVITLAKRGDLHARRLALSIVREKDVVHKLFEEASKRFGSVSGGYTRIVKVGRRPGDAAPVSLVELIASESKEKKKKSVKKTKSSKTKKTEQKKTQAAEKPEGAAKEKDVAALIASEAVAGETSEKPEERAAQEAAPEEEITVDIAAVKDDEAADKKEEKNAAAETGDLQEKSGAEETGDEADKKEDK
jgi:large subunit ribosomal protein L17